MSRHPPPQPTDASETDRGRAPDGRRVIDLALALIGLAAVVVALVGLPLYEDGAYYFFKVALEGAPVLPNLRFTAALAQLPALIAWRATDDLLVLRHAFSLGYALLPWLSLVVCWWLVRDRAPWLVLFPLWTLVAAQINFSSVSELALTLFLCWPFVLAALVYPAARGTFAFGLLLAPLLVFLHPMSFAAAGLLALLTGLLARHARQAGSPTPARRCGFLARWFALAALARFAWTALGSNPYERANLAGDAAARYLLPDTTAQLVLLVSLGVLGLLAVAAVRIALDRPALRVGLTGLLTAVGWLVGMLSLLIAAGFLVGDGIRLKAALTFPLGLGLMALATLAAWPRGPDRPPVTAATGPRASPMDPSPPRVALTARLFALGTAAILVLALARAAAWWTATHTLRDLTLTTAEACVTFGPQTPFTLQWPWMAVIDDWATPINALVFRANPSFGPIALVLPGDGCARLAASGQAALDSWIVRPLPVLEARFGALRAPATPD